MLVCTSYQNNRYTVFDTETEETATMSQDAVDEVKSIFGLETVRGGDLKYHKQPFKYMETSAFKYSLPLFHSGRGVYIYKGVSEYNKSCCLFVISGDRVCGIIDNLYEGIEYNLARIYETVADPKLYLLELRAKTKKGFKYRGILLNLSDIAVLGSEKYIHKSDWITKTEGTEYYPPKDFVAYCTINMYGESVKLPRYY